MSNLITVYIINHNYGRYLDESIRSVIDQNYKKIFIIIVDDASNDNSAEVLRKYENRKSINIIYNKRRIGLVKSANKAIKASKGKYILRLDADDYLKKSTVKHLYSKIKNNYKIKMVFPNFFWINSTGKILSKFSYRHKNNYNILDFPAHGACSLIDLKFLRSIGGYSEKFDRQDGFYIWLRILLKNYKILHTKKHLFFYRKHKNNLSNNIFKIYSVRLKIINFFLKYKKFKKKLLVLQKITKKKLELL